MKGRWEPEARPRAARCSSWRESDWPLTPASNARRPPPRPRVTPGARPQSLRAQNTGMPPWVLPAVGCGQPLGVPGPGERAALGSSHFRASFGKTPLLFSARGFFRCCQLSSYPRCPSPHQTDRKQNAWQAM